MNKRTVWPCAALGVTLVLLAAAYWHGRSRRFRDADHCITMLNVIDCAKAQYAGKYGVPKGSWVSDPTTLSEFWAGTVEYWTNCRAGGHVSIGPIGDGARCSVHGCAGEMKIPRSSIFPKWLP